MSGSGIDELPYPIVPPLQRWFDELGLANTTFFRAELVANYELLPLDEHPFKGIRNQSTSLAEAINAIRWPILRVTVPSKAFGIIPHFAIVAHEIGHALYHQIKWDFSPFAREQTNLITRLCTRLGVSTLSPDVMSTLQRVLFNWFQELTADAFSFYLTGPASFFSLGDLTGLLGGGYGLSITHPAHDLRREILFGKLSENGSDSFADIFLRYTGQTLTEDFNSPSIIPTPDPDQIQQDAFSAYKNIHKAAVLAELHQSMPNVVSIIYNHVDQFMQNNAQGAIYTTDRFDEDLGAHLEALLAAVPPIEVGDVIDRKTPAAFASIINVGWAALLTKLPDLRVKISEEDKFGSEKLERLHALLIKAIELSEARRLWESA